MPGTTTSYGNILYAWLIQPVLTPVAVAANTTAEQSFNLGGLQTSDCVSGYLQGVQTAGIGISNMRVLSNGILQIGFSNSTAGSLTPAVGPYLICICRPENQILPTTAG